MSPSTTTRALIRGTDRAALATMDRDTDRWPYASLVLAACDHGAAPLLLISDLAEHSKNIAADSRLSLLFDGTAGLDETLTGTRASVLGRAERCDDEDLLGRFVARHPSAAGYAGFADFHLYRVRIERAHLVAGFGAIDWIDGSDIVYDVTDATDLAEAENGIISHMNDDHADAIEDYAHNLLNLSGGPWIMTGIDPEGIDIRYQGEVGRVTFEGPVHGPGEARERLVALAHRARTPAQGDAK